MKEVTRSGPTSPAALPRSYSEGYFFFQAQGIFLVILWNSHLSPRSSYPPISLPPTLCSVSAVLKLRSWRVKILVELRVLRQVSMRSPFWKGKMVVLEGVWNIVSSVQSFLAPDCLRVPVLKCSDLVRDSSQSSVDLRDFRKLARIWALWQILQEIGSSHWVSCALEIWILNFILGVVSWVEVN